MMLISGLINILNFLKNSTKSKEHKYLSLLLLILLLKKVLYHLTSAIFSFRKFIISLGLTFTSFIVFFLFLLIILILYRFNFISTLKKLCCNTNVLFYDCTNYFLNLNVKINWNSIVQTRNTDLIRLYRWNYNIFICNTKPFLSAICSQIFAFIINIISMLQ